MSAAANPLGRERVEEGDHWVFRFDNGLIVHTDPFLRGDPERILPIGGPQDTILNRLLRDPRLVHKRRVFEPFAGSGVFGLMALELGARHVDFLDVNPRAVQFQQENADRNGFSADRYVCHLGSITDHEGAEPYDLVLANPPFVPTPPGIPGTLTSDGGAEGSDLVDALFLRMGRLLQPDGEAFVYVMQFEVGEGPLVARSLPELLPGRTVTFTSAQRTAIAFRDYLDAYRQCFSIHEAEIEKWSADLVARHGDPLGIQHGVVHVGPRRPGPFELRLSTDLRGEYGIDPYPTELNKELALARVMENVVPAATD